MKTFMKGAGLCAIALAAGLSAQPAAAQSACGTSYRIASGDTLSKIAARCGTSVSALMQANPQISDPARIQVGWNLTMPGYASAASGYGSGYSAPQPTYQQPTYQQPTYGTQPIYGSGTAASDPYLTGYGTGTTAGNTYAVRPGDTMSLIAQTLGVSLAALLSQNSGINPAQLLVGQLLNLPTGAAYDPRYDNRGGYYDDRDDWDQRPRLRLSEDSGRPGSTVGLRMSGLGRGEWVEIGVRDEDGRTLKIDETRTDSQGRAETTVRVPDWSDRGDDLVFLVKRKNGQLIRSEPFDVTGTRRADRRDRDWRDQRGTDVVEGWIVRGVECPVLRTRGGRNYGLVSDDVRLPLGAYVQARVRSVDMSVCQEGVGTLDVSELRQVTPR